MLDIVGAEHGTLGIAGHEQHHEIGPAGARGVGDLAPEWPREAVAAAIAAAHEEGARVTAHTFGTDALPDLIAAGIYCIEHGTGLTEDLISEMARRGKAKWSRICAKSSPFQVG